MKLLFSIQVRNILLSCMGTFIDARVLIRSKNNGRHENEVTEYLSEQRRAQCLH